MNTQRTEVDFFYMRRNEAAVAADFINRDINTFLAWLSSAIKTFKAEVKANDPQSIDRILEGNTGKNLFPTYDKEKARELVTALATKVQNTEVPNPSSVKKIFKNLVDDDDISFDFDKRLCDPVDDKVEDLVFGRGVDASNKTSKLSPEEQNYEDLIAHIFFSHINQLTHLLEKPRFAPFLKKMEGASALLSDGVLKRIAAVEDQKHEDFEVISELTESDVVVDDPGKTQTVASIHNALSADLEALISIVETHLDNENPSLLRASLKLLKKPEAQLAGIRALNKHLASKLTTSTKELSDFEREVGLELAVRLKTGFASQEINAIDRGILNNASNFIDDMAQGENEVLRDFGISLNKVIDADPRIKKLRAKIYAFFRHPLKRFFNT